jgi:hypothetical protein
MQLRGNLSFDIAALLRSLGANGGMMTGGVAMASSGNTAISADEMSIDEYGNKILSGNVSKSGPNGSFLMQHNQNGTITITENGTIKQYKGQKGQLRNDVLWIDNTLVTPSDSRLITPDTKTTNAASQQTAQPVSAAAPAQGNTTAYFSAPKSQLATKEDKPDSKQNAATFSAPKPF